MVARQRVKFLVAVLYKSVAQQTPNGMYPTIFAHSFILNCKRVATITSGWEFRTTTSSEFILHKLALFLFMLLLFYSRAI